jgi:hypothetical protein
MLRTCWVGFHRSLFCLLSEAALSVGTTGEQSLTDGPIPQLTISTTWLPSRSSKGTMSRCRFAFGLRVTFTAFMLLRDRAKTCSSSR